MHAWKESNYTVDRPRFVFRTKVGSEAIAVCGIAKPNGSNVSLVLLGERRLSDGTSLNIQNKFLISKSLTKDFGSCMAILAV